MRSGFILSENEVLRGIRAARQGWRAVFESGDEKTVVSIAAWAVIEAELTSDEGTENEHTFMEHRIVGLTHVDGQMCLMPVGDGWGGGRFSHYLGPGDDPVYAE